LAGADAAREGIKYRQLILERLAGVSSTLLD
jgi:hypothetical protein